jgi:hypothetical protein
LEAGDKIEVWRGHGNHEDRSPEEPKHFDAAYAKVRFFEVMPKRNRGVSVRALTGDSATPIGDMDKVVCPTPDEGDV